MTSSPLLTSTFWSNVRTLGLVTLVTLLIWVWADAETQRGGDELLHADNGAGRPAVDEAEVTLASLPVMLVMPAGGGGGSGNFQWDRVRPQQSELKGITIAGPRAVIDRIKRGDPTIRLSALLILDEGDWAGGAGVSVVSKGVELAPGSLGLRFAGPAPTVRASLSR